MKNTILLEFHHGGQFEEKNGIKYYVRGKIEHCYNIKVVDICMSRLEGFVKDKLGYKVFKMYWYYNGGVHRENCFRLIWNRESVDELALYLFTCDCVKIYLDHAGENNCEGSEGSDTDVIEDADDIDDGDSESNSSEDCGIDELSGEDEVSGEDEEFTEVKKKEKIIKRSKKKPAVSDNEEIEGSDEDLDIPLSKLMKKDKKLKEKIEWDSEYESDSFKLNELESSDSSDFETATSILPMKEKKQPHKDPKTCPIFNPKTPMKSIIFEKGLIFTSAGILKNAIIDYAVFQKRDVLLTKNDLQRVQAKCKDTCPWYLYASRMDNEGGFQIKSYNEVHNCILVHKHKCVRSEWLARHYGNQIRANPKWKLREFQQHISEVNHLIISKNQCWLAKKLALSEIDAEVAKQYRRLYDYGGELMRSNPDSTCKIKVNRPDPTQLGTFQRIYICFGALKQGFAKGCRKVIGLDGCFLKSYVRGELLSAVAKDGNDQIYPIAWAIVEVENTDSWSWFINLLKDDLNLDNGDGYTIMTDQQKGLKHAIDVILPSAEHRCCARHIYANWRKSHPGAVLKNIFWKAAKSSTVEEYNLHMEEIKQISPMAYEDLLRTESRYWSRAYFNTLSKSDMVDNNLSECFNAWIVEARYKPILELLDDIRLKVMERLHKKRDYMDQVDCRICPRIMRKLNYAIDGTKFCKSTWTGGDECEVRDIDGGQWIVNTVYNTCTCRRWELCGIPCMHGCQALFSMNINPEEKVDIIYSKQTYMEAYQFLLRPMKGSLHWPSTGLPDILPPKERRMPGRPKKNRRKEDGEDGAGHKLSKKGILLKCRLCLQPGHNRTTCQATEEEIKQRQEAAAEAKRVAMETAKATAALEKQKKRVTPKMKKQKAKQSTGEEATLGEPEPKRKRGRPPKVKNVQVKPKPVPIGVGVYTSINTGETFFNTCSSTIKLSASQPTTNVSNSPIQPRGQSSSQPAGEKGTI